MTSGHVTIVCVVGARPNYMKIAPVWRALHAWPAARPVLVHTGQHYDANMSGDFFQDLDLPPPDAFLDVGSGTHAEQTAQVMLRLEPVLRRESPAAVIVVGDVNSTLAAALVAAKLERPVAHVEAGLRSFDDTMPEEINRRLTDAVARWLFTPSEDADRNLRAEGIPPERIHRVGNVMADSLRAALPRLAGRDVAGELGMDVRPYGVLTLHRPSNVDSPAKLGALTELLRAITDRVSLCAPLHPRTLDRLRRASLLEAWEGMPRLRLLPPIGYLRFLGLLRGSSFALTDSGGVQEETTILGVPCLTLRANTERPVTVTEGTNIVVGSDLASVPAHVDAILDGRGKTGRCPPLWEGRAAERIVEVLRRELAGPERPPAG